MKQSHWGSVVSSRREKDHEEGEWVVKKWRKQEHSNMGASLALGRGTEWHLEEKEPVWLVIRDRK